MSLFQLGDFTLASGTKSKWKIECDALTDGDIETLAQMIRQVVIPYQSVEGVPTGGLRLAKALQPFCSMKGAHLIVDDVLTAGGSMEKLRGERIEGRGYGNIEHPTVIGVVLFARGQCPHWVEALFQLPEGLWTKPRHR